MFSSNQHFDVTCTFEDLSSVVEFAVTLAGCKDMFTRKVNRVSPAWMIAEEKYYCLGRGSMAPGGIHHSRLKADEGWIDYPFSYDAGIISKIVAQWVESQPLPEMPDTDGSYELGVRVRCLESIEDLDCPGKLFAAVLFFEPYLLSYDK